MELPANTNAERVLNYQTENGKAGDPAITVHPLGRGRGERISSMSRIGP